MGQSGQRFPGEAACRLDQIAQDLPFPIAVIKVVLVSARSNPNIAAARALAAKLSRVDAGVSRILLVTVPHGQ